MFKTPDLCLPNHVQIRISLQDKVLRHCFSYLFPYKGMTRTRVINGLIYMVFMQCTDVEAVSTRRLLQCNNTRHVTLGTLARIIHS
jgi:hypothetical protein